MKNLIYVLSIFFLVGCNQTVKKAPEKSQEKAQDMSVLVVNYELNEMTLEDHAKLGSDVVVNFAPGKIDGLIGKTFIGNVDRGVFGGVYYFTSSASLDTYLESELWKGIVAHPNLVNFTTDTYGVAPLSVISNGVPIL
ncbi:MAG: YdhR family protein [Bacteroidota bacterium]|nr:YdhR family protein [Bacteroidota bacterium]